MSATTEAERGFLYECGCVPDDVGQAFVDGVLVCPDHRLPIAPFERPAPRYAGRLNIEVLLAADQRQQAADYADAISEQMLRDEIVRGVNVLLEDR